MLFRSEAGVEQVGEDRVGVLLAREVLPRVELEDHVDVLAALPGVEAAVVAEPDGTVGFSVDFHAVSLDGARHSVDDRRRVKFVRSIEVLDVAGLPELLNAQRHYPVAADAAQPGERQWMAVHNCHDACVA